MKIGQPYACDVCQIPKKETNHWWKAFRPNPEAIGIAIFPFEYEGERGWTELADLCGEECAMKYISKNLFHTDREAKR